MDRLRTMKRMPQPGVRQRLLFCLSNIFFSSLYECSRVQIHQVLKGIWMLSMGNKLHVTTTETLWHTLSSSTTISKGCVEIHVLPSPKGVWKYMYDGPHAVFHRLLAVPKELGRPRPRLVELPRRARPKKCFATYDVSFIDQLSRRTTGRLGYIRQDTAHAIGGTAELAIR
jgi:hypothetical protein